jgi:hypothetical protein
MNEIFIGIAFLIWMVMIAWTVFCGIMNSFANHKEGR